MLESFVVENFRLFGKLELNRLGRVNLFVGRNNAGKSALLEAILLYVSKFSPEVMFDLLYARQEHWEPETLRYSNRQNLNPARHFFKNHVMPDLFSDGFKLSSGQPHDTIHVKTGAYSIDKDPENGTQVRRKLKLEEIKKLDSNFYDLYLITEIAKNSSIIISLQVDFDYFRIQARSKPRIETIPYQFVPTQEIYHDELSVLWDNISLTDLELEVVKGLKLIESMIFGLAFVDSGAEGRIPLVKLQNLDERLPLKSLGDGMTRLFQIVLSLVSAKGGVLLIDEFENGLHWEVQEKVWRVVFELAEKLEVQVFATTHSRDCIAGFEKVWASHEEQGAFFRLTKRDDSVMVKAYDLELLSDSLETDVEVR
ncbi:AAA family ATPase [Anaerolineales bacterium HSG24]|nr:AAA family ATPase [Anaerolineales bacterium HSG24]